MTLCLYLWLFADIVTEHFFFFFFNVMYHCVVTHIYNRPVALCIWAHNHVCVKQTYFFAFYFMWLPRHMVDWKLKQ